jgi:hypothetical protein
MFKTFLTFTTNVVSCQQWDDAVFTFDGDARKSLFSFVEIWGYLKHLKNGQG